ncbi:MAG TPA: ion channel [Gemmatimonadaceae bacterium]|nr:ion channel [Gemmatimonadaceae bacterium]
MSERLVPRPTASSSPSALDEEPKDLGFGSIIGRANERRLLERDGTFSARRTGLPFWSSLSLYHYFLTLSWPKFLGASILGYLAANVVFAAAYLLCGPQALQGLPLDQIGGRLGQAFFFSVETLATIGFGNIIPVGVAANVLVTAESLVGLLGFALVTGLLFARFSRPSAALIFSQRALITPYRGATALMFRITNGRRNQLVELEATVLFSRIEGTVRKYDQLGLERKRVVFFPLSWTVVHPISEDSPLWGQTSESLAEGDAEVLILVTGTDETFSQTVHARSSYKPREILFGHRFANIYDPIAPDGTVSIDVRRLHDVEPVEQPDAVVSETTAWRHTGHPSGFVPSRASSTVVSAERERPGASQDQDTASL